MSKSKLDIISEIFTGQVYVNTDHPGCYYNISDMIKGVKGGIKNVKLMPSNSGQGYTEDEDGYRDYGDDSSGYPPEDVQTLFDFISQDEGLLETLDLREVSIFGKYAKNFAAALKVNKTLKALSLWGKIDDEGVKAFADEIKRNTALEALEIGSESGIEAFAEALKGNKTLKYFTFYGIVRDEAAETYAEILKTNTTLKSFYIESAFISERDNEVARKFADALKVNKTLETFKLGVCGANDGKPAMLLLEGLEKNTTLKVCQFPLPFSLKAIEVKKIINSLIINKSLVRLDIPFISFRDALKEENFKNFINKQEKKSELAFAGVVGQAAVNLDGSMIKDVGMLIAKNLGPKLIEKTYREGSDILDLVRSYSVLETCKAAAGIIKFADIVKQEEKVNKPAQSVEKDGHQKQKPALQKRPAVQNFKNYVASQSSLNNGGEVRKAI
jgi:hypothetical protein